jgi:hypothetical protein
MKNKLPFYINLFVICILLPLLFLGCDIATEISTEKSELFKSVSLGTILNPERNRSYNFKFKILHRGLYDLIVDFVQHDMDEDKWFSANYSFPLKGTIQYFHKEKLVKTENFAWDIKNGLQGLTFPIHFPNDLPVHHEISAILVLHEIPDLFYDYYQGIRLSFKRASSLWGR